MEPVLFAAAGVRANSLARRLRSIARTAASSGFKPASALRNSSSTTDFKFLWPTRVILRGKALEFYSRQTYRWCPRARNATPKNQNSKPTHWRSSRSAVATKNSLSYVEKNMSRRLRQNPTLNRQIAEGTTKVWEKQGDLLLPTSAIPVDDERIDKLMATIVRGLFVHEFGFALHKNWDVRVTKFRPDVEANMIGQAKGLLGHNPIFVTRNLWSGHLHLRGGQQFDISEPGGLAILRFSGG